MRRHILPTIVIALTLAGFAYSQSTNLTIVGDTLERVLVATFGNIATEPP